MVIPKEFEGVVVVVDDVARLGCAIMANGSLWAVVLDDDVVVVVVLVDKVAADVPIMLVTKPAAFRTGV